MKGYVIGEEDQKANGKGGETICNGYLSTSQSVEDTTKAESEDVLGCIVGVTSVTDWFQSRAGGIGSCVWGRSWKVVIFVARGGLLVC